MKRKKLIVRRKLRKRTVTEIFQEATSENRNLLVPWYLMTSYLYYYENINILPDSIYDKMCCKFDLNWNRIKHYHKHLIERESLSAGTGYYLSEDDYPSIVKGAALLLNQKHLS